MSNLDIAEVKSYVDKHGREVKEFIPVDGAKKVYRGMAMLVSQRVNPMNPAKPIKDTTPFEFRFPDGFSMKKCFKEFDTEAQKALEEERKAALAHHNKPVIHLPGGGKA